MKIDCSIPFLRRQWSRSTIPAGGFSLIELLTVVAILGIVLALSVSAFQRAAQGNPLGNALSGVTAGLELARQTAIAQNTYTWVRIASSKADPTTTLGMAIYASKSGDLVSTDNRPDSQNLQLISRVQKFPGVCLRTPSDLAGSAVKRRLPTSRGGGANIASPTDSQDTRLKSVDLPRDATHLFNKAGADMAVIMFTPRGEAALDLNERSSSDVPLYQAMQLVLLPQKGRNPTSAEKNSASVVWVNGITGLPSVYQPELDRGR